MVVQVEQFDDILSFTDMVLPSKLNEHCVYDHCFV